MFLSMFFVSIIIKNMEKKDTKKNMRRGGESTKTNSVKNSKSSKKKVQKFNS